MADGGHGRIDIVFATPALMPWAEGALERLSDGYQTSPGRHSQLSDACEVQRRRSRRVEDHDPAVLVRRPLQTVGVRTNVGPCHVTQPRRS